MSSNILSKRVKCQFLGITNEFQSGVLFLLVSWFIVFCFGFLISAKATFAGELLK